MSDDKKSESAPAWAEWEASGETIDGPPYETWNGDPVEPPAAETWGEVASSGETWDELRRRTWDGKPVDTSVEKD